MNSIRYRLLLFMFGCKQYSSKQRVVMLDQKATILVYLAINKRPDISYLIGVLAWYCVSTSFKACQAVVRVLVYLKTRPFNWNKFFREAAKHTCSPWFTLDRWFSHKKVNDWLCSVWIERVDCLVIKVTISSMELQYMTDFNMIRECVCFKGCVKWMGFSLDGPITLF